MFSEDFHFLGFFRIFKRLENEVYFNFKKKFMNSIETMLFGLQFLLLIENFEIPSSNL